MRVVVPLPWLFHPTPHPRVTWRTNVPGNDASGFDTPPLTPATSERLRVHEVTTRLGARADR